MPVAITRSTSIYYDISGEGPPLVLIGGLGFGRWGLFKQVPAFLRHFLTITFGVKGERRLENGVGDLVGEVVSLLDHLGVKEAEVLGTSLGGFVAQELALVRPDLGDHLVLVCTSYGGRGRNRCLPGPSLTCSGGVPSAREVVTFLKPRGTRGQGEQEQRSGWPAMVRRWVSGLPRSLGRLSDKA